jgi:nitrate/TMAO reductase-like tetraheme cytochrome c subunit
VTRFVALARNPVAIAGAVLATAAGIGFLVLAAAALAGLFHNPYAGLIVFIALPALLVAGLLMVALGVWLERRRRDEAGARDWPVVDLRVARVRRVTLAIVALTMVNVAIVVLAGYGGLHAMESPEFCGATCHTPMKPQFTAWKEGPHAGTTCVQCHIGEGAAAFLQAKLSGVRQLAHVITGSYARPIPPGAGMPPGAQAQTCVGCHRPHQVTSDRVRVIHEYADDETNSETVTTLQMRMAAIHSHADPDVRIEYVSTDATNETIPWVKVTRADGRVREYLSPDTSAATLRAGTRRTMDCIDCHNTVGHPIAASPAQAVDQAISVGQINRRLPYARREGVRLMKSSYGSQDTALGAIERELRRVYASHNQEIDEQSVTRAVAALQGVYRRNVFPEMKVTWGSYPDNLGHITSTGCFRCHDGSHADPSGAVISADCESCHKQIAEPVDAAVATTGASLR